MHRFRLVLLPLLLLVSGCRLPAEPPQTQGTQQTEDRAHSLDRWMGEWQGEMVNLRGGDASEPIPVQLRIGSHPDGTIEWRTLYNDDLVRGLKDYRLVAHASDPSRFTIDEQNGIRLTARLMDDALIAPFEVGGQFLLSRYSLESDDRLRHEVIVWSGESSTSSSATGPGGEQGMPVVSFEVSNVQRTLFHRVPDKVR